jgi:hypothetical protein
MFFEIDIHENGLIKKEDLIRQFETYEELQQMINVLNHVEADRTIVDLNVEIMVAKFKQVFNHFFSRLLDLFSKNKHYFYLTFIL